MALFKVNTLFAASKIPARTAFARPSLFKNTNRYQGTVAHNTAKSDWSKEFPSTEEIATGPERADLDHAYDNEIVRGPLKGGFGTLQHPVIVKSYYDSRIVGCLGSKEHEHDLLWHEVKAGKPTVCLECGQVFALEKVAESGSHGHH
eukprot:TRINITY_DN25940_c0_g1_i1.p1 TRINITY_DN25940_c0_g1~~TRINITY_DN25940_c0_g1_i1.p1  ORF type:complete len:147 (+),score=69.52 TRINITY_DN25940_c0_g1_i1:25-465(+)